jgi:ABC-type xylose transport system permease subunit
MTSRSIIAATLTNLRGFGLLLLTLLLSLYAAWMINAQVGYGYSWLYSVYEIDSHIEKYAPQNRFRQNFELTSEDDHKAIFQAIVDSVHNQGAGLADIHYFVAKANNIDGSTMPVLHEAEIIHLNDVAVLIDAIHQLAAVCAVLLILLGLWQRRAIKAQQSAASKAGMAGVFAALVAVVCVLFVIFGAKKIFYQLHVWIFPDNHQWFFYYQDSLMSTLMKAPDLFAGIAIQILLLGLIIFFAALMTFKNTFKHTVKKVQG